MSFQRAARTDKGVSAIGNLLSLKMELAEDTLQKLNDVLPKQIRVFGIYLIKLYDETDHIFKLIWFELLLNKATIK